MSLGEILVILMWILNCSNSNRTRIHISLKKMRQEAISIVMEIMNRIMQMLSQNNNNSFIQKVKNIKTNNTTLWVKTNSRHSKRVDSSWTQSQSILLYWMEWGLILRFLMLWLRRAVYSLLITSPIQLILIHSAGKLKERMLISTLLEKCWGNSSITL
jgi:hypothetical protein